MVFPSVRRKVMRDNTLSKIPREHGVDSTVHGFRSSFRHWCAETGKRQEDAEAALAHVVGGVEGSYFRSDLFERRRELMDAWADYLADRGGQATPVHGRDSAMGKSEPFRESRGQRQECVVRKPA